MRIGWNSKRSCASTDVYLQWYVCQSQNFACEWGGQSRDSYLLVATSDTIGATTKSASAGSERRPMSEPHFEERVQETTGARLPGIPTLGTINSCQKEEAFISVTMLSIAAEVVIGGALRGWLPWSWNQERRCQCRTWRGTECGRGYRVLRRKCESR